MQVSLKDYRLWIIIIILFVASSFRCKILISHDIINFIDNF